MENLNACLTLFFCFDETDLLVFDGTRFEPQLDNTCFMLRSGKCLLESTCDW